MLSFSLCTNEQSNSIFFNVIKHKIHLPCHLFSKSSFLCLINVTPEGLDDVFILAVWQIIFILKMEQEERALGDWKLLLLLFYSIISLTFLFCSSFLKACSSTPSIVWCLHQEAALVTLFPIEVPHLGKSHYKFYFPVLLVAVPTGGHSRIFDCLFHLCPQWGYLLSSGWTTEAPTCSLTVPYFPGLFLRRRQTCDSHPDSGWPIF